MSYSRGLLIRLSIPLCLAREPERAGARKLEGGRQGGVCSCVPPGLPEEHRTRSQKTGDLGSGVLCDLDPSR